MKKNLKKKMKQKFFNRQTAITLFFATVLLAQVFMPGCGNKNNNNSTSATPYVCQPGQICNNGVYTQAQGVPLLNSPTTSILDGQGGSTLVLTYGANGITAGQSFNGMVNISGTLTIANGACYGMPGGTYQVTGQGQWVSGYGGAIAQVQGQLTVSGGYNPYPTTTYNPYQPTSYASGGTLYIAPALVRDSYSSGYPSPTGYSLTQGYGVYLNMGMCSRSFAFYN
jgi:hypothetical protein